MTAPLAVRQDKRDLKSSEDGAIQIAFEWYLRAVRNLGQLRS